MRNLMIPGVLAGLLLAVACTHTTRYSVKDLATGTVAKASTRYEVAMLDFRFEPDSLNVLVGDTVTWVNHGRLPHTTTSGIDGRPDGRWESPHLARGGTFSYVFAEPGTFRYYCTPHHSLGMKGVVVVAGR